MADHTRRLSGNVPGDFFVDASCIDCDACRQIAPQTFREHAEKSIVFRQPRTDPALERALMALVACPTASIGTTSGRSAGPAVAAFPERIDGNVYFCGFTAEASFGAWSYLIVRPEDRGGNILVDSPRFVAPLVHRIEALGGIRLMLLTHRDDVADHAKFAAQFGCTRVMHTADGASSLGVEKMVDGEMAVRLDDDLLAVPTPGHTRGHMVFLYEGKYLFTGDHLAWSPELSSLTAFDDVAWYSWPEQVRSLEKLRAYRFEWVLPGHGRIHRGPAEEMQRHLQDLLSRIRA